MAFPLTQFCLCLDLPYGSEERSRCCCFQKLFLKLPKASRNDHSRRSCVVRTPRFYVVLFFTCSFCLRAELSPTRFLKTRDLIHRFLTQRQTSAGEETPKLKVLANVKKSFHARLFSSCRFFSFNKNSRKYPRKRRERFG